jgi:hypothetical protein
MPCRAPRAAHFGLARTPFGKAIAVRDLLVGDFYQRYREAQTALRHKAHLDS